jgi:signal transduction histidine kinase
LIQNETLQLIKQVEPDLPAIVVDQEKLKQILMNFLSNAVKFTEKGSIKVTASRQGNELVIVVTDTGIGIPEHALQRVFDEFRQVDDSRTRQRGGTGLGLSISRHLARLMGGDVIVESAVGVGSTFSVSIPLRLPEQNTGPPVIPSRLS